MARSSYDAWHAGEQTRSMREQEISPWFRDHRHRLARKETYGVQRLHANGRMVNRKPVKRLMREHGIAGHSRRTGRRSLTLADRRAAPTRT
ncbi:hypothetical protein [Streptomyces afghaniensis]|uniref:hypothetical protein n=1 Tax=Streptomyces afghaniensis TaxID=66865 RepID=UPI002780FFFD|nr:hypothetical protein [Streptomyces afghaniensis]MDQ1014304.1 hypothetical protein [Streptomyces afghaniensis]